MFHLKIYLSTQVDPRFKNLFIVAVAAFVRNADTDIRPVWNWNSTEGIIYVDELPQFFQANGNPRFAARPSRWIVEGLNRVPRPDVIETVAGNQLRGFLMHSDLALDVGEERPLLANVKRRRAVQDCPTSCQELQSRSDQLWVRFYLLACGHHCAYHIDHRCCECRARDWEKSSPSPMTSARPHAAHS